MLRTAGGLTVNQTTNFAGYYGSFYSSVDQAVAVNTPIAMAAETTADADGVTMELNASSKKTEITFAHTGTYNIQFSAQLYSAGGGGSGETVDIWFALNGASIADSATKIIVPSNAPFVVAAWNFIVSLAAGDYVEIYWITNNANIRIEHVNAASPVPAIPSVIITAQQIR
jgi:hypothetical protein